MPIKPFNFRGLIIDWEKATLHLEILNGEGELHLSHSVPLKGPWHAEK